MSGSEITRPDPRSEFVRILEPAAALIATVVLVALVHSRAGDELAVCEGEPCPLGSGASWIWTGAAVAAPACVWAGLAWTRRLHRRNDLGPFAHRAIPDVEEIAEILMVVIAIGISYLLIRNGPAVPIVEATWPNSWLTERLGREGRYWLVPSRSTWFLVGSLMAAPLAFSFGTAIGREWFGRRPGRSAELSED